ncbi:DNA-binding protein [Acidiplasma cupricumulans]|nr:DNA-binding protein [Acidiplasma cupricumulans]
MSADDDELERIRQRKLAELERESQERAMESESRRQAQEEEARKQQILRQILSSEARERLNTLRLVKPELVDNVENQLIQLASMGRINRVISDAELKNILLRLTGTQHETK